MWGNTSAFVRPKRLISLANRRAVFLHALRFAGCFASVRPRRRRHVPCPLETIMIEDASERWLIDHLRAEATRVKQCYAEFSFRALAIAAAGLALILGAISNIPIAAFASAPLV